MTQPTNRFILAIRHGLVLGLACAAGGAWSSSQLAVELGCFSCNGTPPRANEPTFPQLAAQYARYQDVSESEIKLADKLREAPVSGGIRAHEHVSGKKPVS